MDHIQHRRNEQEQEFDRFRCTANHASHHTGDQQAFNFMTVFRFRTVIHCQCRTRQAAEEGWHFALRQELRRAFRETVSGRAGELRLEDGQRAADFAATDIQRATGFGEADQRHQNMMQTER
ncbi:hypothetical protein D3C80_1775000 [compost metagenome]